MAASFKLKLQFLLITHLLAFLSARMVAILFVELEQVISRSFGLFLLLFAGLLLYSTKKCVGVGL